MSTEQLDSEDQISFVRKDLSEASSDPKVNWIVVFFHKLMYGSPNVLGTEPVLVETYQPIFQQYHVDLVLQGHLHAYERTYPILYNPGDQAHPIVTTREQFEYNKPDGLVLATVGTGGQSVMKYGSKADFAAQQYEGYGFLDISILDGGTSLAGKFYNNDGELVDHFVIGKAGWENYDVQIDKNQSANIRYRITGGDLVSFAANTNSTNIIAKIRPAVQGTLVLELPRSVIQAQGADGHDVAYVVLVNGQKVPFEERESNENSRVLFVDFDVSSREIEIVGTSIIPEFPAIGGAASFPLAFVMTAALAAGTVILRFRHAGGRNPFFP
jgi:hypothetical protein